MEVFTSVKMAVQSPHSKDAEDLRQAIMCRAMYKGSRWRVWSEATDPALPALKKTNAVVQQRDPDTAEIIAIYPTTIAMFNVPTSLESQLFMDQ